MKLDLPAAQDGYVFLGTKVVTNQPDPQPLFLGAVSITAKADSNILALLNTVVQGALKVKGATGDDNFVMDDTVLTAASTVDLGGGTNFFQIEQNLNPTGTSQIFAPLLLKGGADDDHFILGGNTANTVLRALAQVTLDGGADTDPIVIGTNASFVPPLIQKNIP